MAQVNRLSVSKIEAYLKCPLAFKYRYIDKIPELASPVLVAGNAFHEVVEHALKHKASSGRYPDWKTLDDLFGPAWDRRFKAREEDKDFVGWNVDPEDPVDRMKEEYRALVRLASDQVLPKINPWVIDDQPVVEYRVDLELETGAGKVDLLGYVDLLDASGMLMDWKTTRQYDTDPKDAVEAAAEKRYKARRGWLQFAAYSLWSWPVTGMDAQPARKILMVRGKEPRVDYADMVLTERHRDWFVKLAGDVWRALKAGIFPGNNTGWWCSHKFCSFYGPCQEGIGVEEEA